MTANCDTVTNRVNPQEVFLALLKAKTYVGTAVFQVTTPGSSSTGGSGVYNTESIDKEISAVMSVRFRIN